MVEFTPIIGPSSKAEEEVADGSCPIDFSFRKESTNKGGIMTATSGPRGHWLLGCMKQIRSDPLGLYSRARQEFGDYVRIRGFAFVHYYLLTHPAAVEHILQKNQKNYRKPDVINRSVGMLVGQGLFTSAGDLWLKQRRLMQPVFRRQHLAMLCPLFVTAAEAFLSERLAAGADRVIDIQNEMTRLTLRIASTTLFSTDISGEADVIGKAYRTAFAHISRRMNSPPFFPGWLPTPGNIRFGRARALLNRVVLELIETRRSAERKPEDLLTLLLAAQDEDTGIGMSDQQLRDEALTLLSAGHETVSAALSWTWYLLGQHPQVQQDVYEEVKGLLGGRSPTSEDLPNLPLTRAVFEESMRLYPPAWGLGRETIAADEIEGFPLPAKSLIVVCQYVTHRHPEFWKEPEEFRPKRFLPTSSAGQHKFAYFPFGGGSRACIGNNFALMEGMLVLATILQRFRVELLPDQDIVPDPTFTLRPRHDIKASLWPR